MVQPETRAARKSVKQKRRAFGVILVLSILALAILAFVLTREHPVTERAARISNITDYCWINDNELIWFGPLVTNTSRVNLSTHAQVFLTEFHNRMSVGKSGLIDSASVSPDGKRLLCSLPGTEESAYYTARTCITDLDGERTTLYGSAMAGRRGAPVWMPDSRRWLEFTTADESSPQVLSLYSLDAPDRKVGPLPVPQGMRSLLGVTPDYRMIASSLPPGVDQPMFALFEAGIYPNALPEHHSTQSAPAGWFFRSAVLSPKGDRVACLLTTARQSALLAFFAKIAPSLIKVGRPSRIFQIRICRADGTHIQEVGFQDTGPDGTATVSKLHWTPDGRHLSFVLKDSLYIIPVP